MSTSPDSDFDLDLHFLPDWAKKSADYNRYADYGGEREPRDLGRDNRRAGGPRPPGRGRPPGRPAQTGDGPPRDRLPRREDRGRSPGFGRGRPEPKPEIPLPEVDISFIPDEKGVELLSKQIRMTGRAYPIFEIALMILQKPERHAVTFRVIKKEDGQVSQPLFVCVLDDTLWLSEDEAVRHVLDRHFDTFYQAERTPVEPPKGTYTFVAQCGMSGVILGPPNYHDYQNLLHRLHAERFARMPFEAFKSRVKIVRDEAVVKKWIDEQSWKTAYVALNLPEPVNLATREDVERHFREVHLPNIIRQVESHTTSGVTARNLRSHPLQRLVRVTWEELRRFPLRVATVLSQQFAAQGLQFFKVNKTVTHVCVARPHYLDLDLTPVSAGVKRIVEHITAHPRCNRRDLVEALAPTVKAPSPSADLSVMEDATPAGEPPGVTPGPSDAQESAPVSPPVAPPSERPSARRSTESAEPTEEQTAVIADLHWLIHQGHVIEFASGMLETARKPAPKPPPRPKEKRPDPSTATEAPSSLESSPANDSPEGESADSVVIPTGDESAARVDTGSSGADQIASDEGESDQTTGGPLIGRSPDETPRPQDEPPDPPAPPAREPPGNEPTTLPT